MHYFCDPAEVIYESRELTLKNENNVWFLSQEPRLYSVLWVSIKTSRVRLVIQTSFKDKRSGKPEILLFKARGITENTYSTTWSVIEINWSSYKGLTVDTLAHRGDEGRGYLRYVSGSWIHALIREFPNGATLRTASWIYRLARANPANWNILVAGGKESK